MSWTWAADDLRRWSALQKAVATVLRQAGERGQPYKGAVAEVRLALKAANKARFPTHAQSEIAILRQWLSIASSFVAHSHTTRPHILPDLARSQALASALLQISGEPPRPLGDDVIRMPYRDD